MPVLRHTCHGNIGLDPRRARHQVAAAIHGEPCAPKRFDRERTRSGVPDLLSSIIEHSDRTRRSFTARWIRQNQLGLPLRTRGKLWEERLSAHTLVDSEDV